MWGRRLCVTDRLLRTMPLLQSQEPIPRGRKVEHSHENTACCSNEHVSQGHDQQHHSSPLGGHGHVDVRDTSGSRLLMTLGLNFLIPVVQVVGGIQANSMALISDAAHNFSDFTAVLIAYIANRIGQKGASMHNTFGYRRVEILAAVINVALLLGAATFIVYEAIQRLQHPQTIAGRLVVLVAGVGVLGNGLSAWLLHRDAGHNLNVRGAFLHMLGDLLTSVVVAVSGVVLIFRPWYWLDPILSVLIALFILKNCWTILKEATCILMNATPNGLDISRIKSALEQIPGISGVHYLHAWNVCSSSVAFSCHVVVPDQKLSKIDALSETIRRELLHRFGVDHPILQFETSPCGEGSMFCEISCGPLGSGAKSSEVLQGQSAKGLLFKKPLLFWVRLILGAVFIIASVDKIYHPAAFAQAIYNYQIIPGALINIMAIILPWLEVLLGLFLIIGLWLPGTVTLTNVLLLTFFGALVFNMARGLDVHCGCFSTSAKGDPAAAWYLVRDAFFLLMGGYLFVNVLINRPQTSMEKIKL
jgi:cobalt-zinc-cadmium efflux system protein